MTEIKKTYEGTSSKLRFLWQTALKLIGDYEDFNRRLVELEKDYKELSYKISKTSDKLKNV